MQLWHRLSLEHKSWALIAGFFLLATFNAIAIYFFQNQNETDAKEIITWQSANTELKELIDQFRDEPVITYDEKLSIERKTAYYDNIIKTFREGGRISKQNISIPSATDEEKEVLDDLKMIWDEMKHSFQIVINAPPRLDTIVQRVEEVPISDTLDIYTSRIVSDVQSIANPAIEKAKKNILQLHPEWQKAKQDYLDFLIRENEENQSLVTYISIIFWLFTLLALLILVASLRNKIFNPLREVISAGDKISMGAYNVKIKSYGDDEIGKISGILSQTSNTFKSASSYINALGEGKLDKNLEIQSELSADDETISKALIHMREQMEKLEIEDKERKWISEGLANFGDLLRTNNESIEKLTDKVTSSLVKYTGSLVGGIYLLNDHEPPLLELMAFYAMDTKKYNQKTYRPGEGLVGQTFLEEDYIYLLEIPENYISITTGIGETSPKAILLVPLKVENEIFGVVELASLREYKDYEIDFVRKLSEIIASTIQNVKINQRTKKLLQESQEMTEQMRSQEEEMRQNMEELSATQEEMGRKEQEISSRLEAINNTLALAEYNVEKEITHANENFAGLFNSDIEDIIGRSQEILIPETEEDYNDNLDLWKDLKIGKTRSGIFVRKKQDGKKISIQATYTPVKNGDGEVIKIIELAEEVKQGQIVRQTDQSYAIEVEEQLRQHLEALEITNKKLKEKLDIQVLHERVMKESLTFVEVDEKGNILKGSEELETAIERKIENLLDLEGINEEIFLHEQTTGEIKSGNKQLKYFFSRLKSNLFLFVLINI